MTTTHQPIPALAPGERFPTPYGDVITKPGRDLQVGDKWLAIYKPEHAQIRQIDQVWVNGIVVVDQSTHYIHPKAMVAVIAPEVSA